MTGTEELAVSPGARLGDVAYGETRSTALAAGARYGAFRFVAEKGDVVHMTARATTGGNAVLWLTNASFRSLQKVGPVATDGTATLDKALDRTGEYWIVFAEAARKAAIFEVSIAKANVPAGAGAGQTPVGASTCDGKPCFAIKGGCWDKNGTQPLLQSYANVSFVYSGTSLDQLNWRDDRSLGTSRATERLYAWLTNYRTVFVDGVRRGMSPYWDGSGVNVFVTARRTASAIELNMDTDGGPSWCQLVAELH